MKKTLFVLFCALSCVSAANFFSRYLEDGVDVGVGVDVDDGGVDVDVDVDVPPGVQCFSGVSIVNVFGKGPVEMKRLEVGDRVLSGRSDGSYDMVYAHGHLDATSPAEFLQIWTKGKEKPLEISEEHLVFVQGKRNPVRADSIKVHDALQGQNNEAAPVTEVRKITRNGRYAPLTTGGSLVVNGIKASSYVTMQKDGVEFAMILGTPVPVSQHDIVHMTLSPLRMLCLGMSSGYCKSHNDEGIQLFVSHGMKLVEHCEKWNSRLLQMFALVAYVVVLSLFLGVESIFGPTWAAWVVVGAATAFCVAKTFRISIRATRKAKTS